MTVEFRPFARAELSRVLEFVGLVYRENNFSGPHPGDISHTLSNGMRGKDIEKGLWVYEENGQFRAAIQVEYADSRIYSLMIHPDLWATPIERELYVVAERVLLELTPVSAQKPPENPEEKPEPPAWWTTTYDTNPHVSALLQEMGYKVSEKPFMNSTLRDLVEIPPYTLPEGFTIRSSIEADVEQLCAVHSGAFGSKWTPPEYLNVMRTPGFDPSRERVVVAPDGQFAAFCIYWPDPVSKAGEFEPVGCHSAFQRRGLTRALMYDTMHLLKAAGMTRAMVVHQVEEDNPASAGLYKAAGFQRNCSIYDTKKIIP